MSALCRKRHVFYLAGFDPRGVRHYHNLYKTHAALQNNVNGLALEVGARQRVSAHSFVWPVTAGDTQTEIEFLAWDDIIRREWGSGMWPAARDFFFTLRVAVLQGFMFRLCRVYPRALYAGLYPLLYGALFLALAGICFGRLIQHVGGMAGFAAGATVAGLVLWAGYAAGRKIGVFWLLGIYAFSARWGQGSMAGLEDRIHFFAERIRAAGENETVDEVVVVGHSVGAMLAVPVLAALLRQGGFGKPLILMTLGQCIPLISLQKTQQGYRDDLALVSASADVLWVDYTAPADGACFAQTNPVTASGIALPAGAGPKILSPRFFKLYNKENYARLKYRWYTMHFLYLMSSDLPGEYDYFAMTAGATPFASRFTDNAVEA